MVRKILLMSMVLMLAGILATAQNNTANERFSREIRSFENLEFEKNDFPILKKQKSGEDWWLPDTVYIFQPPHNNIIQRQIYQYNQQGLLITEFLQYWQDDTWKHDGQCTYTYDANNNLLTKLHENWGSNPWKRTLNILIPTMQAIIC